MKYFNIEEFIQNKMKFISKHLDGCKKPECHTCDRLKIKQYVYEELIIQMRINKINES